MPRRRTFIWIGLAVTLLVIGSFAWVMLTEVLGVIYLPSGTETVGNFTIKSYRTEGFGHTSSKQTLYFRGHKLGDNLSGLVPSPLDPDRALYERYCADGKPGEECGLFYFDGRKERTYPIDPDYKVSLVAVDPEFAEQEHHPWSADGRFVMIQDQYKLLLVDLETGEHADFAERLDAQATQQPMPPTRAVYFAGWSEDMREAVVLLYTDADARPPVTHFVTDIYTVDPAARELHYRCTVGPYGLGEVEYVWQGRGEQRKFAITSKPPGRDLRTYDKNTNGPCR